MPYFVFFADSIVSQLEIKTSGDVSKAPEYTMMCSVRLASDQRTCKFSSDCFVCLFRKWLLCIKVERNHLTLPVSCQVSSSLLSAGPTEPQASQQDTGNSQGHNHENDY